MHKIPLLDVGDPIKNLVSAGTDFAKIEKEARIYTTEKIGRPPVAISIGETNFGSQRYPIPFGSYGDYSCIVGSSKTKKTFLKSALLAGYIGGSAQMYFEDFLGHDTQGKYIIDLDTEQSRYHSQMVFKRVEKMVGSHNPYYVSYSLRKYSAAERMEFIDWLVYKSQYAGKIGILSIDGYADLINDFNSVTESNMLQDKLLKWSTDAHCHITGVLHKNFGSEKPVGHIGSAILKKAETVVFLDKPDGKKYTEVKCSYSRNFPFENFCFEVNADWIPYQVN